MVIVRLIYALFYTVACNSPTVITMAYQVTKTRRELGGNLSYNSSLGGIRIISIKIINSDVCEAMTSLKENKLETGESGPIILEPPLIYMYSCCICHPS